MLKPYTRNRRDIDKLLSEIEQAHYTYSVLKYILTNNLTDIVYNKQVRSNQEYKNLNKIGNNTRLVIRKFDKEIDVSIYSSLTGGCTLRTLECMFVGIERFTLCGEKYIIETNYKSVQDVFLYIGNRKHL